MTVYTRSANPSDVDRIVEIDAVFYGEHGYGPYAVRQFLDLFGGSFFVSEDGGRITGYAVVGLESLSRRAWLLSIVVERTAQRRGVGAALMQRCLAYCQQHRIERCALTVKTDNASAISLYEKCGFSGAEGPQDYYGDGEPRIVMERRWS